MKVGFELEIEDVVDYPSDIPGVARENDGSLRNGMEFITGVCPDVKFATMMYSYLFEAVNGIYSERCGLHFHINFKEKSIEDINAFVARYITIERALFRKYSSVLREGNSFCNLLLDSPDELDIIRRITVLKN